MAAAAAVISKIEAYGNGSPADRARVAAVSLVDPLTNRTEGHNTSAFGLVDDAVRFCCSTDWEGGGGRSGSYAAKNKIDAMKPWVRGYNA